LCCNPCGVVFVSSCLRWRCSAVLASSSMKFDILEKTYMSLSSILTECEKTVL
jgi:hypothetical protein